MLANDDKCSIEKTKGGASSSQEDEDGTAAADVERMLPDHTISMRHAMQHCKRLAKNLFPSSSSINTSTTTPTTTTTTTTDTLTRMPFLLHLDEKDRSERVEAKRRDCYEEFWSQTQLQIETIDVSDISPQEFRNRFHNRNLPCLITGWSKGGSGGGDNDTKKEEADSSFQYVNQQWINQEQEKIHREWFAKHVGEETVIPLRYPPPSLTSSPTESSSNTLDSEGRATECKTRHVSMKEWIEMVKGGNNEKNNDNSMYYLKDWHLVLELKEKRFVTNKNSNPDELFYKCPEIFQHDLLNSFLTKFTKGDYRFCYWGPKHSATFRHADVLHSFSWSYNVIGTKEWTFFGKTSEGDKERAFTVVQATGQAMFVPCTWQHQVVNLEETISINHNWITTANIDKTWECLVAEQRAIERELKEWGIADNLESCESMLRGCVGLDVTSFFLMVLVRILELLESMLVMSSLSIGKEEDAKELSFDVFRLGRMLRTLIGDESSSIELRERLGAVLQVDTLAKEGIEIAKEIITLIDSHGF